MDILAVIYVLCIITVISCLYVLCKSDDPLHWTHRFAIHRIDIIMVLCVVSVLMVMIPCVTVYQYLQHHAVN